MIFTYTKTVIFLKKSFIGHLGDIFYQKREISCHIARMYWNLID